MPVKAVMQKSLPLIIVWVLLTTGANTHVQAQRRGGRIDAGMFAAAGPEFGPRVGYDFDAETWSVGGQVRLGGRGGIQVVPSADVYLDTGTWQLNFDGAVPLGRLRMLYGGAGVGILHNTVTETHLNLFLGLRPVPRRPTRLRPYAEARWTLKDGDDPFRLVGGVNVAFRVAPGR